MATVLVVDDDPNISQLLCDVIADLGHTPLAAAQGRAGLALARAHHPDLILSDVMMPVMDGYALLQAIRADPALAATRVYLMSAALESERNDAAVPAVTGFIRKPFELTRLEHLLQSLLT
ncbi:MAG TPA: response regulator [Chloroflexaceae bacterium]|nr:response regulator [Chloroflexaceae bacterium]